MGLLMHLTEFQKALVGIATFVVFLLIQEARGTVVAMAFLAGVIFFGIGYWAWPSAINSIPFLSLTLRDIAPAVGSIVAYYLGLILTAGALGSGN